MLNTQCSVLRRRGFSLVEMLVGLGLLAVVTVTVSGLLFSALRGGRKAAAITAVKTEGAHALNSMLAAVKYAQRITNCGSDAVSLVAQDGSSLTYRWETASEPDTIASVSSTTTVNLTSTRGAVSRPVACGASMFDCQGGLSTVKICFAVESSTGIDVTERAGVSGLMFTSQATLRSW